MSLRLLLRKCISGHDSQQQHTYQQFIKSRVDIHILLNILVLSWIYETTDNILLSIFNS